MQTGSVILSWGSVTRGAGTVQDKIRQSFAGLQGGIGQVCSTAVVVLSGKKTELYPKPLDLMMMFSVIDWPGDNREIDH
ncbi:hypothetical protein [Flexithrix dorotheae]|uniref:hypothetical protein n=1 Tax=Flexithrix dorotheae TaxID=70993 RepID=UPI000475533B|nr:hypothetical protein [Flexithrix dorotheae]